MIDSALGHPEKGIVNLNMLHSLLHEILNHLDKETTAAETPGLIKNKVKDLHDAQPVFSSERKVLNSEILSETDAQLPHVIFGEVKSLENVPRYPHY